MSPQPAILLRLATADQNPSLPEAVLFSQDPVLCAPRVSGIVLRRYFFRTQHVSVNTPRPWLPHDIMDSAGQLFVRGGLFDDATMVYRIPRSDLYCFGWLLRRD